MIDDKEYQDELDRISALADEILANDDETEYDELDEEESDDAADDDEAENDSDEASKDDTVEIDQDFLINQEILTKANELLGGKKPIIDDSESDEVLYGKYEIIYSDGSKTSEKYTKLNEDTKLSDFNHEDASVTINKIKADIDKYADERNQIQNFLAHNNKEMKISEARGLIEACLFVLGSEGLNAYDLKKVTDLPLAVINNILDEMTHYYLKNKNSGFLLVQYGNKYKFVVKSQYYNYLNLILNKKERKALSDSVLETLAIIAYNQPCTKGTIEKIRNKSCLTAIERLKDLGLIEADERSEAIGKPWLYSVTQKFFDLYGIKSLSELPMINRDDKNYTDEVDVNADFINEINEE